MNKSKSFREILSRSFATIKANPITGDREDTKVVTGQNYLAEFEIEKLVSELREYVANNE